MFTATQIRTSKGVSATLAGTLYPDGIFIHPEDDLERLIHQLRADLTTSRKSQGT